MSIFAQQPWFGAPLDLPQVPIGMLGEREAALFYYLARDWFRGRGAIVDAGSFLGKSAFFFAHGLRANRAFDPARHRVHCFDNFVVNEARTVDFLREHFGRDVQQLDSTRDLFERQVASVRSVLEVHEGDFEAVAWQRQPVEILMVDIAKSESLGAKVVSRFFRDLMPGQSVVVHQDYHHAWLPHIHVVMEHLHDCFEMVAPCVDASAAFLLVRDIPESLLQQAARHAFSATEQLALMDRAVARFPANDRWSLEMARLVLRSRFVAGDEVRRELDALGRRAAAAGSTCVAEVAEVLEYVDSSEAWRCFEQGQHEQALRLAEGLVERGRTGSAVQHVRAEALAALGRWSAAEQVARGSLAVRHLDDGARLVLARALAATGRYADAEREVFAGLGLLGRQTDAQRPFYDLLADVWQRQGDAAAVLRRMPALRAEFGHHGELWRLDAYIHAHCGDRGACLASLRQAIGRGLSPGRLDELRRMMGFTDADLA